MHAFSRWMALAALVSGAAAHADQNDLQITRLGRPNEVQTTCDPEQQQTCATGNSRFQAFARAFAAGISSTNLMPPETVGHAGFNVNMELAVVSLPSSIELPTEGTQPSTVLVPSFHVRKGLPFSIELGGRVGWVEKSRMVATTGELKWAANEGFTYLPDIGARLHVTRLMGVRDFGLTSAGLDLGIGKQFPLGGMITLTPYGGLDFNWVGADTDTLDFNPNRPYNDSLDGDSLGALQDTDVYKRVKLSDNMTQRIYGGARFIGGVLQLGAEISFSRLGSVRLDPRPDNEASTTETRALPTVVTFSTSLGLDF
ncbi:hypothetical protein [Hyalangium versicolor]|uniref:hypothetical protein n=1 Tax=Hyalangium versicolor TaxID=2861190 RepID=UPI001CCA9F23|nr:hypothetical protein [Hyalangium versicolor]